MRDVEQLPLVNIGEPHLSLCDFAGAANCMAVVPAPIGNLEFKDNIRQYDCFRYRGLAYLTALTGDHG